MGIVASFVSSAETEMLITMSVVKASLLFYQLVKNTPSLELIYY